MHKINLTYQQRIEYCHHPLAKKLFQLMEEKQTNLCLSADMIHKKDFLALVNEVGPAICVLKTHIDIIADFEQDLIDQLEILAKQHQFLIFEDRKFADIGHTVKLQYEAGIYHIASWADIINAHSLPGVGIIEGLKETGMKLNRGLLLLAEMSSKGNLIDKSYVNATVEMALAHKDFVMGFIAQGRVGNDPGFVVMTPGVGLVEGSGDHLKQNYLHPDQVIGKSGSDIIIVGRGIYAAQDPALAAQRFRALGWQAYLNRIKDQ